MGAGDTAVSAHTISTEFIDAGRYALVASEITPLSRAGIPRVYIINAFGAYDRARSRPHWLSLPMDQPILIFVDLCSCWIQQ